MNLVSIQAPAAVVMIRPHRFLPNPQTAADNAFQRTAAAGARDTASVSAAARDEVTAAAHTLAEAGVRVHVFDDHGERDTPDYIEADHSKMSATFVRRPGIADVPYPVQMEPHLVVEFYSR